MSYALDDPMRRWHRPQIDESWKDQAACRNCDPELFFPSLKGGRNYDKAARADIALARLICKECPVQLECLQFAIDTDERYGIYGGLTQQERYRITGRRPE